MSTDTGSGGGGGKSPKPKPKPKPNTAGSSVPTAADMLSSYQQQAADIYAPQFGFLNDQAGQVKQNYGQSDAKLAQLYANLIQSINGDASGIKQNYQGAIGQNTAQTKQGLGDISNIYGESQAKEAALLQSLGIQAAAPDVFAQGTRDRGNFMSVLASNGAAFNNQLNAEKASSLAFNKQAATISKEQGAEHRSALQQQLQTALTNIAAQRAQLQSQQSSTALQMQQSAAAQLYKQQQDQAQNDLDYAKLALQYGPNSAAAQKADMGQGYFGALKQEAKQFYPTENAQQNAIKAVTDTLQVYPNPTNAADFIQHVLARNPHATDVQGLSDLAQLLFKELGLRSATPSSILGG